MIYSAQIRAARGLLGWSQPDLASEAGVSLSTVKRMEASSGLAQGHASNIWRLQEALMEAGVVFIAAAEEEGPGVRLLKVPD